MDGSEQIDEALQAAIAPPDRQQRSETTSMGSFENVASATPPLPKAGAAQTLSPQQQQESAKGTDP